MALTEADRERARQLAAAAPAPTPELVARLRAILAGCAPVQNAPAAVRPIRAAAGQAGETALEGTTERRAG